MTLACRKYAFRVPSGDATVATAENTPAPSGGTRRPRRQEWSMYVHCCKTRVCTVQADQAMELSVAIQAGLAEPPRLAMPGKDPEGKVVRRTAKSAIGELRPCQGVPRVGF